MIEESVKTEYDESTDTLVSIVRRHVKPDRMEKIEDFTFHLSENGEIVAFEVEKARHYFSEAMLDSA